MNPAMVYALSQEANLQGEMVVSIRQGDDPNLKDGGVCRAMSFDWSKARLKDQPWRGFSPASQRLPLIPNNSITKKFPWVNSRVAITPQVQELQDLSAEAMVQKLGIKMITQEAGEALESPTRILDAAVGVCRGNFGVCVLGISSHAPGAVQSTRPLPPTPPPPTGGWRSASPRAAVATPKPILAQSRPLSAHALAFRITASANEFFDANSGWYNFASIQRLSQFFVLYIGATGYRSTYPGPWEIWSIV